MKIKNFNVLFTSVSPFYPTIKIKQSQVDVITRDIQSMHLHCLIFKSSDQYDLHIFTYASSLIFKLNSLNY